MCSDTTAPAIEVTGLGKTYTLYPRSSDRLLHALIPSRSYPTFDALKDVSLSIPRGTTVGVIGQNGAGKSTLLQLITGTLHPSAGNMNIEGRVAALLELGAGMEPEFSGRENIYLNATILGLSRPDVDARFDDIVAFSELGEFIDQPVKTYSSGMFMRLAFSVVAHVDADVLIIDEALAVGDALFVQKCMRFLNAFKKTGTILFVSHDMAAVTALCDEAIWLDHGQVRERGPASEVCEAYVQSLFEGQAPSVAPAVPVGMPSASADGEHVVFDLAAPPAPRGATTVSPLVGGAESYGEGGVEIVDVWFEDSDRGARLSKLNEQQAVQLVVRFTASQPITQPIVGFYIKDRLGQNLMGDNSYSEHSTPPVLTEGGTYEAVFGFDWPALAPGAYTITVAVSEGTHEEHVHRHWIHDALVLEVLSSSVRHAAVGLTYNKIAIRPG